ncbi:DUF4269 domain-containing protein [Hyphomonas sp.]|uniref:DUF4269 domain-containing protein n=1 Tax=Hyphomonas sp. TaxID=87 RepID=UPI0025C6B5C8|nr:DUF4269 domain-containing protein [Hyphomonas sp.]
MYSQDEISRLISRSGIMNRLEAFDPQWVGSSALDVHGPDSDVDICCSFRPALEPTSVAVDAACAGLPGYAREDGIYGGKPSRMLRFWIEGQAFEVWGRAHPVGDHEFWRYTQVQRRLLTLFGMPLRQFVRQAKAQGASTEAAFANAFGVMGDAHSALEGWFGLDDSLLRQLPFKTKSP